MTEAPASEKRIGLAYWMQQVLDQRDKLAENLGADPVHDLRTALRRCRSLADGIRVFDRNPAWNRMRKAGKQLFSSLGDLRDTHVMGEWVERLAPAGDATGKFLADYVASQEQKLRNDAATALRSFDPKQWKGWTAELPKRGARIPIDSPLFAHLALERWHEAHALHSQALRNRTKTALHQLRIGIKHLRYTVENFLPSLHQQWGKDLKELQDILGEVHDLDVLWQTAISIKAFPDAETRLKWQSRIQQERGPRLDAYREKMVGSNSLWPIWRARLPQPEELRSLAFARLQAWASFLDPEVAHPKHVAALALQLYDSSVLDGILSGPKRET